MCSDPYKIRKSSYSRWNGDTLPTFLKVLYQYLTFCVRYESLIWTQCLVSSIDTIDIYTL